MTTPSEPVPIMVSVDLSGNFGGIFTSAFICAVLLGISFAQAFMYFRNYPKDRMIFKLLVVWLIILNLAAEILVIKGLSRPLLKNWCNIPALQAVVPEFVWQILMTGLLSSSAQIFFTYRLWIYSGKNVIYPLILVPAALSQLVADIIYINGTIQATSGIINLHGIDFERAAVAANSIAVGVDILVATLMGHRLLSSRSGFSRTDKMITRLFIITVNSGLWTAVIATVALITSLKFTNLLDYAAIYILLAPLYCNTVLANLNVRDFVKGNGEVHSSSDMYTMSKFEVKKPKAMTDSRAKSTSTHSIALDSPYSATAAATVTRLGSYADKDDRGKGSLSALA